MKKEQLGDFFNPYGFVPLSKNVFTMTEREQKMLQYCHDIPFKDSMSGYFDVTFEAITPFCVGSRREIEEFTYTDSKKRTLKISKEVGKCPIIGNNYYIPGSSIKGMIENVFRIISFGKIGEYIDDTRYSVRDLKADSEDYDLNKEGTKSGFLVKLENDYYILPCNSYQKTFNEIENITRQIGIAYALEERGKSIKDKYDFLRNNYSFIEGNKCYMWLISGHMDSKRHEHLFEVHRNNINKDCFLPVSEAVWDEFLFIHEQENDNKSWKFWKQKLKNYKHINEIKSDNIHGLAPVFYREDENGFVKDFGFSRLYRQPYRKSIHDCLPETHKKDGSIDLAQAVFGYSNKEESLKGRVRFSHAICASETKELSPVFITPGSPKASFYPFYLNQKSNSSYVTYGSENAEIQGWKRFLMKDIKEKRELFTNPKIQSVFRPLQAGTQFTCRITYHNLRPFELGALLNAIDFFEEDAYHSLGYAKPFGFGKIAVKKMKTSEKEENTRKIFEEEIEKRTGISVVDEDNKFNAVLSQLLFLASDDYKDSKENRYPYMGNRRENIPNEFKLIKQQNKNIRNFNP
ncbi:MAG: TIGR03986 family CRISPR-associated RAMP protein [Rickettsiales bacterium]|jgi:CRISPR-associated protein (TIGR03986 family)|nr:TIGR03986 family CRISPR-associated RAMP protein [Rickettsiales bacterium]